MADERTYPTRPFVAASAAILRDGKILVVRRARAPANGVFSLPGGVVETGETLHEAVAREVMEETGLTIEPVALAGYRETIVRDKDARGAAFRDPAVRGALDRGRAGAQRGTQRMALGRSGEIADLPTTPGLAGIVAAAMEQLKLAAR